MFHVVCWRFCFRFFFWSFTLLVREYYRYSNEIAHWISLFASIPHFFRMLLIGSLHFNQFKVYDGDFSIDKIERQLPIVYFLPQLARVLSPHIRWTLVCAWQSGMIQFVSHLFGWSVFLMSVICCANCSNKFQLESTSHDACSILISCHFICMAKNISFVFHFSSLHPSE